MQEIKVKEIRGPLGKGEKKFYAVVDEKGGEFTTFDTKIQSIKPGSVLEAEIKVEGKYVNIVKWTLLQEPETHPRNGKEPGAYKRDLEGIQFEYELKARLQQIERASIEAQTAYNGIIQLWCSPDSAKNAQLSEEVLQKALKWAESRLDESMKPAPKAEPKPITKPAKKPVEKPVVQANGKEVDPEHPFPNIGVLLTWCAKEGIDRTKFMEILEIKEKDLPNVNIADAHQAIQDYLKQNPKDLTEGLFD